MYCKTSDNMLIKSHFMYLEYGISHFSKIWMVCFSPIKNEGGGLEPL